MESSNDNEQCQWDERSQIGWWEYATYISSLRIETNHQPTYMHLSMGGTTEAFAKDLCNKQKEIEMSYLARGTRLLKAKVYKQEAHVNKFMSRPT